MEHHAYLGVLVTCKSFSLLSSVCLNYRNQSTVREVKMFMQIEPVYTKHGKMFDPDNCSVGRSQLTRIMKTQTPLILCNNTLYINA